MTVAIDWDDTLVGYKKYGEAGVWLPDAITALRTLRKKHGVVINSCRGNWTEGRDEIERTLRAAGFRFGSRLKLHEGPGKPLATHYIDDRAVTFTNNWQELLRSGPWKEVT